MRYPEAIWDSISDIDDVVGILHVRDLLCTAELDTLPLHKTHFVPETTNADIVLREMLKTKSHIVLLRS